jgi:hypothetical protein
MKRNHRSAGRISKSRRQAKARTQRPLVQALEQRRLFAATLDIVPGGVLVYNGSAVANNLSISVSSPSGAGQYFFNDTGETITVGPGAAALGAVGSGTNFVQLPDGAVNAMLIDLDGGTDILNILSATDPINVNTANGVPDTTNIGNAGNVDGVLADIFVQDTGGVGNIVLNDFNNPNPKTIAFTSTQVTGLLPAGHTVNFGAGITAITAELGFGGNTVTASMVTNDDLDTLNINSGDASDNVTLLAVNAGLSVNVQTEIGGGDAVTIGSANSTAAILGFVSVADAGGVATLTVSDSAGATNRTVTLANTTITGMTPNPINYQPGITTLNLSTGSGADSISVNHIVNDDLGTLNLNSGGGADTVSVLAVDAGLTANINTDDGTPDHTYLGSAAGDGTGTTANILGTVNVQDTGGAGDLVIDNGAEATARSIAIGGGQATGATGTGTSLVTYGAGISDVTVFGGTASDNFNVTPEVSVLLHINGGLPVSPTFPGDHLDLTLAGAADASVNPSGDDGTITFSNRATITYTSIESIMGGVFVFSTTGYVVNENGGGAIVTVQRVNGSTGAASVTFSTTNGTAVSPADYTAQTLTLNFANGETFKNIFIPINDDSLDEPDETFNLTLTGAVNGVASATPTTVTILDNDPAVPPGPPQITINNASVLEGNSGTKNITFTVSLSQPSSQTVTVKFATQNNTALLSDYVAKSGTLTFNPFQTSKQITVQVKGDTTVEPDETFFVNLSAATNATIADNRGVGTIRNDDTAKPLVSITDVTGVEGQSGLRSFVFTITLSQPAPGNVSVNFATSNGTASSSSDYNATSGTVTFSAGQTSKTVTVTVKGDSTVEANETFFVKLTNPIGAVINKGTGKGTILNDD